jgi:hypothetical protein
MCERLPTAFRGNAVPSRGLADAAKGLQVAAAEVRPKRSQDTVAKHARCEVVADAGHAVWIDQPERCPQLVSSFIND